MCLYVHLRKMATNKIVLSNLLIPVQGHGLLEPLLATYGTNWDPTLDRMPFQHRTTHIHTHTLTGTMYAHPFTTHAQLWVVRGRGTKYPEKTHADLRRTCKLHTVSLTEN